MLKPRKSRNHFYTNYVEVNLYDNVCSCKKSYSVIADISPVISEENYSSFNGLQSVRVLRKLYKQHVL